MSCKTLKYIIMKDRSITSIECPLEKSHIGWFSFCSDYSWKKKQNKTEWPLKGPFKACESMVMFHLFMTLVGKLWVPFRESDSLISKGP